MTFNELKIGDKFLHGGTKWQKTGIITAEADDGNEYCFTGPAFNSTVKKIEE